MIVRGLALTLLPDPVAICRLAPGDAVPAWVWQAGQFASVSRTAHELSIAVDERVVPAAVPAQRGHRLLRVEGPLAFDVVGVVAALAGPLAAAEVPIFPVATYDTDYLLLAEEHLAPAIAALEAAGHRVTAAVAPVDPDLLHED